MRLDRVSSTCEFPLQMPTNDKIIIIVPNEARLYTCTSVQLNVSAVVVVVTFLRVKQLFLIKLTDTSNKVDSYLIDNTSSL